MLLSAFLVIDAKMGKWNKADDIMSNLNITNPGANKVYTIEFINI